MKTHRTPAEPAKKSRAKRQPVPVTPRDATVTKRNKRKAGRPSIYSPKLADRICQRLVNGESLRAICADPNMPDKATVLRWADRNPEFRGRYARARELLVEFWADELIAISDGNDDVSRDRLRVDARKWLISRLLPQRADENSTAEPADGDAIESAMAPLPRLPPTEVALAVAALIGAAEREAGIAPGAGPPEARVACVLGLSRFLPPALYRARFAAQEESDDGAHAASERGAPPHAQKSD
jgi:hypothetical protein